MGFGILRGKVMLYGAVDKQSAIRRFGIADAVRAADQLITYTFEINLALIELESLEENMIRDVMLRNNVAILGDGTQPMLFAHGFGCDQNMWRYVTPYFRDDYKIVLFDYIGSGKSDPSAYNPQRYSSLDGYTQDVLDICEALDLHDVKIGRAHV